jgi:hypothetical protein
MQPGPIGVDQRAAKVTEQLVFVIRTLDQCRARQWRQRQLQLLHRRPGRPLLAKGLALAQRVPNGKSQVTVVPAHKARLAVERQLRDGVGTARRRGKQMVDMLADGFHACVA